MSHLDPSLAALLADHAAQRPAAPALRVKARGRWRALTWAALDAEVTLLARALAAAGLRRGERVWLIGSPAGARLLALFLAVDRAGGVPAPVDVAGSSPPPGLTGETAAQIATAPVAFVEDHHAFERLAALGAAAGRSGDGRSPTTIVFDDPRGLRAAADGRLRGYEAFRGQGAARPRLPGGRRAGRQAALRALLLPIAWRDDALAILRLWVRSGFELCLAERHGNLDADTREVAPRVLLGAASAYAGLVAGVLERLPPSGTRRRRFIDGGLSAATATTGHGAASTWRARLARVLVVRPLRRMLGLHGSRLALLVGGEIAAPARALLEAIQVRPSAVAPAFGEPVSDARVLSLPLGQPIARGSAGPAWREASVPR